MFVDISETTSVLLIHINNIRSETEGYEMNVTDHSVHRINDEVFIFTSIMCLLVSMKVCFCFRRQLINLLKKTLSRTLAQT